MTVTTTLENIKTIVAGLVPSTGAAANVYAIPADANAALPAGGLDYTFPIGIVEQRLGNDAGQNSTQASGASCFNHIYHVEIMIGLVASETVNEVINKGKLPTAVIMSEYESTAQVWLLELHNAFVADKSLSGTVIIGGVVGSIIEEYRIGYLPWENPGLFGLWCSLLIREDL